MAAALRGQCQVVVFAALPMTGSEEAFGVTLGDGEHVVFAFKPPPVSMGERVFLVVMGIVTLVAVVGLAFLAWAFIKRADRAWVVTNQRIINVTGKGVTKQILLADLNRAKGSKSERAVHFRLGADVLSLPLDQSIGGMTMLEFARDPSVAAKMPPIEPGAAAI
jgi:hypothetical protein